jgi:hypothetical protein
MEAKVSHTDHTQPAVAAFAYARAITIEIKRTFGLRVTKAPQESVSIRLFNPPRTFQLRCVQSRFHPIIGAVRMSFRGVWTSFKSDPDDRTSPD